MVALCFAYFVFACTCHFIIVLCLPLFLLMVHVDSGICLWNFQIVIRGGSKKFRLGGGGGLRGLLTSFYFLRSHQRVFKSGA